MKPTDIKNKSLDSDGVTSNVIATYPEEQVGRALKIMAQSHIHHLPVVDGERIVGMLNYTEVIDSMLTLDSPREFQFHPVSRYMRTDVPTVTEKTEIRDVLRDMSEKRHGALPVVRGGKLIGIVTERDMLKVLERLIDGSASASASPRAPEELVAESGRILANPLFQRVILQIADMGI